MNRNVKKIVKIFIQDYLVLPLASLFLTLQLAVGSSLIFNPVPCELENEENKEIQFCIC